MQQDQSVALILPREVPLKFRVLAVSSPALGNNPRWEDPIRAAREALQEAGVGFVELTEDETLSNTLRYPERRIVVLPFVDMLPPGTFGVIERFVAAGGKVIGQNCYAGEYGWWPDAGFYFNCYVFSHDYRGPLLANIIDYLLTGRTLKPSKAPLTAPRSMKIGQWQSPSLLPGPILAEWDLLPDTLVLWVAAMEQPRAKVEEHFARALDSAAARGGKIWLTTHYDHPTPKGFSSYLLQGKSEWPLSRDFVTRLKPGTRDALEGFVLSELGTAQIGKCAYFTEAADMRDAEQKQLAGMRPVIQKLRDNGMRRVEIFEASLNHHHNYEAGADTSQLEMGCGNPEPLAQQCAGARGMARAYGRRFVSSISLWYGACGIGQYGQPPEVLWQMLHTSHLFGAEEVHLQAEPMGTGLICGGAPRDGRPRPADYEEVLSAFSRWSRTVERIGDPEVSIGVLKGNYDAWPGFDTEAGLCGLGRSFHLEQNAAGRWVHVHDQWNELWKMGPPEHGWRVLDVFYPKTGGMVTTTPYGLVEIVPLCAASLAHLNTFRLLVLAGWNTMTSAIATKLTGYVRDGGTLVLALPHLSSHVRREDARDGNYRFDVPETAELAGFQVTGHGQLRWLGAQRVEGLPYAVHKIGRGACYCFTAWSYPGSAAVLKSFQALCHRLAGECSAFQLRSDGKVAGVPYRDAAGRCHVQLLNYESSAQRVRIEAQGQTREIGLAPRTHRVAPW